MNGEDVGGSRLSVCTLSALGRSCQFGVTLDWQFVFIVEAHLGLKSTDVGRKAYNLHTQKQM